MTKDKYQIRLLPIAEVDFTELISYIAYDNPLAVDKLANKIEKNLELLSENPQLGRIIKDEDLRNLDYRYLIVQNYLLFYTIEENTILVHRILHGARDYKSLL